MTGRASKTAGAAAHIGAIVKVLGSGAQAVLVASVLCLIVAVLGALRWRSTRARKQRPEAASGRRPERRLID